MSTEVGRAEHGARTAQIVSYHERECEYFGLDPLRARPLPMTLSPTCACALAHAGAIGARATLASKSSSLIRGVAALSEDEWNLLLRGAPPESYRRNTRVVRTVCTYRERVRGRRVRAQGGRGELGAGGNDCRRERKGGAFCGVSRLFRVV
jgi:hypothetical protein